MGDKISFSESVVVTLFSMTVVFVVLIVIAFLIYLLKVLSIKKKKEIQIEAKTVEIKDEAVVAGENSEELIAVIAAAVASSLGLNIPDINIKSIRRIPQNSLPWSEMGKKEQLLGKL